MKTKKHQRKRDPLRTASETVKELGEAAQKALQSWEHMRVARRKGSPLMRKTTQMGKAAVQKIKKAVGRR